MIIEAFSKEIEHLSCLVWHVETLFKPRDVLRDVHKEYPGIEFKQLFGADKMIP